MEHQEIINVLGKEASQPSKLSHSISTQPLWCQWLIL